jgi:hypothetical protein
MGDRAGSDTRAIPEQARSTGLGRAMVYGMVQRHNAELEIDSAPGQGTTVRISFPLALTAVDGTIRLPALPQALGSLDILIVDDDPLVIESLRATLQSDGHRVTAAGKRALTPS